MFDRKYKKTLKIIEARLAHYTGLSIAAQEQAKTCTDVHARDTYEKLAKEFYERQMSLAGLLDEIERKVGKE